MDVVKAIPKQKQEIPLSFRISEAIDDRLDVECALENNRPKSDMAKILIAEALLAREAKRNTYKIL